MSINNILSLPNELIERVLKLKINTNTSSGVIPGSVRPGGSGENTNSFFSNSDIISNQFNNYSNLKQNNNNTKNRTSLNQSSSTNNNNNNQKTTITNNSINQQQNVNNQIEETNQILNEMVQFYNDNSSNQETSTSSNDEYLIIFIRLSQVINGVDEMWKAVIIKYLQFMTLLCRSNQPSLASHSDDIHHLFFFLISIINNNNTNSGSTSISSLRVESLKALSSILYNNGPNIPTKLHQPLVDTIIHLIPINSNNSNNTNNTNNTNNLMSQEIKRLATVSIGNLCNQCGPKLSKHYPVIFERLYSNLEKLTVHQTTDKFIIKFCCSTLRSLQLVLQQCKGVFDNKATSIFNLLKKLMFFGTNINPMAMLPSQLHTVEPIHSTTKYIHRKMKKNVEDGLSSSDSDVDERAVLAKVRLSAISLLQVLAKTSPKLFFGYWSLFLPSSNFLRAVPSIFTSIIHDHDPRIKQISISLLTTIFDGSKDQLLSITSSMQISSIRKQQQPNNNNNNNLPFTSLSQGIVSIIKESHKALLAVLEAENNNGVLVSPILKCLSVMALNIPYNRIDLNGQERMLPSILSSIQFHLFNYQNNNQLNQNNSNNDTTIIMNTLISIENILVSEPSLQGELTSLLIDQNPNYNQSILSKLTLLCSSTNSINSTNLTNNTDQQQQQQQELILLKMQIRSTICALTKHYFSSVLCLEYQSIYNDLFQSILSVNVEDQSSRIQSSKILEELSKTIHESSKLNIKYDKKVEKVYWDMFFNSLGQLIEDPLPQIRSSICNCLSHLSSDIFASLSTRLQLHCVSVILGLSNDESYIVRASSCRTIGMFVKIEVLSDDTTFLSKAASCLYKSMCDNNVNIKIKACWSLANLCDHLVSIHKEEVFNDIPTFILCKVVEVMLLASYDNPKVRSNAVRALGNFARFAPNELLYNTTPVDIQDIIQMMNINQQIHQNNNQPQQQMNQQQQQLNQQTTTNNNINQIGDQYIKNHDKCLLDRIVDSLVMNAAEPSNSFNFVKVKWNACYALGNIFYNPNIQFQGTPPQWLHTIYSTLIQLVTTCKNYKIKINASASMATCVHQRDQYGQDYHTILETILKSLSNVNSLIEHSEYQYKDILEKQLGVSLIHLIGVMNQDEFKNHNDLLLSYYQVIHDTFEKLSIDLPQQQNNNQNNNNDNLKSQRPSSVATDSRPTIQEYNNGIETIKLICQFFVDQVEQNDTLSKAYSTLKQIFQPTTNSTTPIIVATPIIPY